jgi:hypothetical protein
LCLKAYTLVDHCGEYRDGAKDVLLAIGIVANIPEAIEGLSPDGDPSEEEVNIAKLSARKLLMGNEAFLGNIGIKLGLE